MIKRRIRIIVFLFLAALIGAGCGQNAQEALVPAPEENAIVAINLTPAVVSLKVGETQQFQAVGVTSSGVAQSSIDPVWTVNGGIGTIDPQGKFTARQAGSGEVLAAYNSKVSKAAYFSAAPGTYSSAVSLADKNGTNYNFTLDYEVYAAGASALSVRKVSGQQVGVEMVKRMFNVKGWEK